MANEAMLELPNALERVVPHSALPSTTIGQGQTDIYNQVIPNIGKSTTSPSGPGTLGITGMSGIESSYDTDSSTGTATDQSGSAGTTENTSATLTNLATSNNTGISGISTGVNSSNEWVQQLSIANQVLNAAGLVSKGFEAPEAVTKTIGIGSTATGGLLTAYNIYKAFTGTSEEKKSAYANIGSQAALYGLKQLAAQQAASTAAEASAGISGAVAADVAGAAGTSALGTAASILTGGISNVVCFRAGTPVSMEDGTIKNVEDIELFDVCMGGGMVTGKGVALSIDHYYYNSVYVTGSHAVLEDGKWKRVRESIDGVFLNNDIHIVYIINNVKHLMVINGITFSDYGEMDDGMNYTEDERIVKLNENSSL